MKLRTKMILFCLAIGLVPLLAMVGYSINSASDSLERQSFAQLESVRDAKKTALESVTARWFEDVRILASVKEVFHSLGMLREFGYLVPENERMDVTDPGYQGFYDQWISAYTPFTRVLGYDDVILIDDYGRVLLTVQRGPDLGQHVKGALAETNLAEAYARAMEGEAVFTDFAPYVTGEPAAFTAAPVRNHTGEVEAVVALCIPLSDINGLMKERSGMGQSGESILVGPDNLMRSDSIRDPAHHSVHGSFASPGKGMVRGEAVSLALDGESGTVIRTDFTGNRVLSAYAPLKVDRTRWALLAEMDADEAFASVANLKQAAIAFTALTALLVLVVMALFLRVELLRPLRTLQDFAAEVAAGNLNAAAQGRFKAELAQLRADIVRMVDNLKAKMAESAEAQSRAEDQAKKASEALHTAREAKRQAEHARRDGLLEAARILQSVVENMNQASEELESVSREIIEGSNLQIERVDGTVTAMEQMNSGILEVARKAAEAGRQAEEAHGKAEGGENIVRESVHAIEEVAQVAEELRSDISQLGEQAESIGRIIGMINDIADQTNLLSLNAAIEAARAGEAGRGFAVVADEVRKLAEKTMSATKDVSASIQAIQDSTGKSVQGMDKAATAVGRATELAERSSKALQDILALSEVTQGEVLSIQAASEEQSAASEEINSAVQDVETVSRDTADGISRSIAAIENLSRQTEELANIHHVFQVIGEGRAQRKLEELAGEPVLLADDAQARFKSIQDFTQAVDYFDRIWLTDARGRQVTPMASTGRDRDLPDTGTDWSHREWFTKTRDNMETFVSNLYYSEATHEYCLTIAVPVRDDSGALAGVLGADLTRH
jgi:methyl-accepting chemotaxis protein